MADRFKLIQPRFTPPLEEEFRPAVLANRAFEREIAANGAPLILDPNRNILVYVQEHIRRFSEDVTARLKRVS
ncbi:MAG TPA: hypothetical protein VF355_07060 [Anaerolineaceae bacterium]